MATRSISTSIRLDGERQFNQAMEGVNRNIRAMSAEVRASESAFLTQGRTVETLRGQQKSLQAVFEQTKEKVRILSEQLRDLEEHGQGESASADRVRASLASATAQMNRYEAALRGTSEELRQMEEGGHDAADALREMGESGEGAAGQLGTMDVALGSLLADLGRQGVELLREIGQIGIEYNAQIESYTQAMTTALGSAEEAARAIEAIRLDAAVTPYSVDALVRANQLLIAAGESADDARATVMALSDAVSATGGGNDELQRMAQNLQQIKNVGKATAMDIKQFQMAGIDVYGILAEYTGMAVEDAAELTVSYELLSAALQSAAQEGGRYFGANAAQARTLNGQISTLQDNVKSKLGEAFKGVSDTLSGKLLPAANDYIAGLDMEKVVAGVENFLHIALEVGGAIAAITAMGKIFAFVEGWSKAAAAIKLAKGALTATGIEQAVVNGQVSIGQVIYAALTGEIEAATAAQLALNVAQAAAPYAILAAGIGAIILAIRGLNAEADKLTQTLSEPWLESDNIEEVKQQLDEVKAKYEEVRAAFEDPWNEEYTYFDVKAYGNAVEALEAHYAELAAAEEAAAKAEAEHQAYMESTAGKIETVSGKLEELKEAYDKAYQSARESLQGQFDLFQQVDPVVAGSTEDIITALESQAAYFDAYSGNLTTLQGMTSASIGLNADLVASLSDGSEKSVMATATIAKGYEEALAQGEDAAAAYVERLNAAWDDQQKAAEKAAEAMVQDQAKAIEQMELELQKLRREQKAEALQTGKDIAQAAADGFSGSMSDSAGDMEDAAQTAGSKVVEAFQRGLNSITLSLPSIAFGTGAPDGSHAGGLDYVPFDGYIAELHRGEMVVPADAAQALRQGGGAGATVNIYAQEVTEATVDYIYQRFVDRAGGEI